MNLTLQLPPRWLDGRNLQPLSVGIVGAGGNGSAMADGLGALDATLIRLGSVPWNVTVYDGDTVSAFNVSRQRFTHSDIGCKKATMLVHRINLFHGLLWRSVGAMVTAKQLVAAQHDLIVTCVDKAGLRLNLAKEGKCSISEDTLWLDLGVGAEEGQVVIGHLGKSHRGSNQRIPHVCDLFPQMVKLSKNDREGPSCSTEEALRRQSLPVNRICADIALDMLYHLIRRQKIDYHGIRFTLNPLRATPIACDTATWALYGWLPELEHPQASARKFA